jgi:hypothetical protein
MTALVSIRLFIAKTKASNKRFPSFMAQLIQCGITTSSGSVKELFVARKKAARG